MTFCARLRWVPNAASTHCDVCFVRKGRSTPSDFLPWFDHKEEKVLLEGKLEHCLPARWQDKLKILERGVVPHAAGATPPKRYSRSFQASHRRGPTDARPQRRAPRARPTPLVCLRIAPAGVRRAVGRVAQEVGRRVSLALVQRPELKAMLQRDVDDIRSALLNCTCAGAGPRAGEPYASLARAGNLTGDAPERTPGITTLALQPPFTIKKRSC